MTFGLGKYIFNKVNSFTGKPLEHIGPVEKHSYVFTDNLFPAYVTDLSY
jgi:hypothetical protein